MAANRFSVLTAILSGTLATIACGAKDAENTDSGQGAWDTESPDDETKSTHLWVVHRGMDILAKHTSEQKNAANTLAWLKDDMCKTAWQNGLLEADFLAPFNAGAKDLDVPTNGAPSGAEALEANFEVAASGSSWMSHFYDPKSGLNYEGFKVSGDLPDSIDHPVFQKIKTQVEVNGPVPIEAHGAALHRVGRAKDLLSGKDVKADHPREPQDPRSRGCYELGLALHYFTDLTQPMHASNFAATDAPRLLHSNWEGWAEEVQARFVRADWSHAPTSTNLDEVIQTEAIASKAQWATDDGKPGKLFASILEAFKAGGTWDENGAPHSDKACFPAKEDLKLRGKVELDVAKCWKNNPGVLKETGVALGNAQEMAARFLATLDLPAHD